MVAKERRLGKSRSLKPGLRSSRRSSKKLKKSLPSLKRRIEDYGRIDITE